LESESIDRGFGRGVVADVLQNSEGGRGSAGDMFAVAFERWPWVEHGVAVGSDYCRTAWLPAVGPAAWLLWGSVTRELAKQPRVEWSVPEIARFHGIGCSEVTSALERLEQYGLAVAVAAARWRVRSLCPMVWDWEVEAVEVDAPAEADVRRRAQVWGSRNRPIASRGAR
jgi:hypothetical protein